jgi:hypothetical protein
VISDDLSAAITAIQNTQIPKSITIISQSPHPSHLNEKSFAIRFFSSHFDTPSAVSKTLHVISISMIPIFRGTTLSESAVSSGFKPLLATSINMNPNERASDTYTGTKQSDTNSLKLNFAITHSPFVHKKYISQNTGESIIYIHNRTTLIKRAKNNAMSNTKYTSKHKSHTHSFQTRLTTVVTSHSVAFAASKLSRFSNPKSPNV